MNKVGRASSNTLTSSVSSSSEPSELLKNSKFESVEPSVSNQKGTKQEAKTREKDSELQAIVRKETLFAQVNKSKAGGAAEAKFVHRNLKNDAEVRKFVSEKAYPVIAESLEKAGLGGTEATCNLHAGMLITALKKQGIEGAAIRFSGRHAYVEVPTKKGTLILDPTMSQFFKEGSDIHTKLKKEGFVGTKQEFEKMLMNNI
jgi:hypothetical protein